MIVLRGICLLFALCTVTEVLCDLKKDCKDKKNWPNKGDEDTNDIAWFKKCIVEYYKFVKDPRKDEWKSVPSLRGQGIGDDHFNLAADRAEAFFIRNNDWGAMKKKFSDASTGRCPDLLTITAARYIYVTYVLYEESGRQLQPCNKEGEKTVFPAAGSCFPPPYGSARCTSDYDVGLVGPDSGFLTGAFNDFFMQKFKKPSEQVFDTNVYAFTLEFAIPSVFTGLQQNFTSKLAEMNGMPKYKMQEVAASLYKVYKYSERYYSELFKTATDHLKDQPGKGTKWLKLLRGWNKTFEQWDQFKAQVDKEHDKDFRQKHNEVYQAIVSDISVPGELLPSYMAQVGFALLYAAEAYHTRGAIRHVVGQIQMGDATIKREMKAIDYWVSMIENWGDSCKEFNHCSSPKSPETCLVKMCKYLWRVYHAMKALATNAVVPKSPSDPAVSELEAITLDWLKNYKSKPKLDAKALDPFKKKVKDYCFQKEGKPRCNGCDDMDSCMDTIQRMVQDYHMKLITVVNANKI